MSIKLLRRALLLVLLVSGSMSFGQTITGEITSSGVPLPGVNVIVKGTTNGVIADFDGRYSINNVAPNAILVIRSLGYVTKEIPVNGQSVINVALDEDIQELDEVVVTETGYGRQRRANLTTAIGTVAGEQISEIPAADVGQTLQGRVAGITVINGGSPGERTAVRIRGLSTIGSGDPLYVVDGVFTTSINNINPSSIQKIDVLKDAAAAAVYGSRGSNGVIIITTDKGTLGKTNFKFSTYTGLQSSRKRYDLLNTAQYVQYIQEINAQGQIPNAGGTTIDVVNDNPDFNGNGVETDWQEELFRTAPITNYDFSASGGSEKGRYNFGFSAFDQDGIYIDTNFKRYTFNIISEANITEKFKAGQTFALGLTRRVAPQVSDGREPLLNIIASAPYTPVRNPDGSFSGSTDEDNNNSRNQIRVQDSDDNLSRNTSLIGSLYAQYEILPGLSFRTQYGLDAFYFSQDNILRAYDEGGQFSKVDTDIVKVRANQVSRIFTNLLSYNKTFGNVHNVDITLVSERQDIKFETLTASSTNPVTPLIPELVGVGGTSSITETEILISYLGRVNYNYAGKYLLSGSIRRDKSSLFGPNNQVGIFPAASLGWVISRESFLAENTVLTNLKLRASYGVTGNNRIPRDVANANLAYLLNYPINNQTELATAVNGIANPDVKWERTTQVDVGLDFGFFSN
ncbi:MAG: SusC/RagA family TonB-linked outer membrane protein, partial [Bacteroidota bacterium]